MSKSGATSRYNTSLETAERVEAAIREKIGFLARFPGGGHWRRDLTDEPVKFFPVHSYLIVYRPETTPLRIVAVLHGRRELEQILKERIISTSRPC